MHAVGCGAASPDVRLLASTRSTDARAHELVHASSAVRPRSRSELRSVTQPAFSAPWWTKSAMHDVPQTVLAAGRDGRPERRLRVRAEEGEPAEDEPHTGRRGRTRSTIVGKASRAHSAQIRALQVGVLDERNAAPSGCRARSRPAGCRGSRSSRSAGCGDLGGGVALAPAGCRCRAGWPRRARPRRRRRRRARRASGWIGSATPLPAASRRHLAHHQHVAGCATDDARAHGSEQQRQRAAVAAPDHDQVGVELVRLLHSCVAGSPVVSW